MTNPSRIDDSFSLFKRTGLTFDKDGILVPSYQIATESRLKRKLIVEELNILKAAIDRIQQELDVLSYIKATKHVKKQLKRLRFKLYISYKYLKIIKENT